MGGLVSRTEAEAEGVRGGRGELNLEDANRVSMFVQLS